MCNIAQNTPTGVTNRLLTFGGACYAVRAPTWLHRFCVRLEMRMPVEVMDMASVAARQVTGKVDDIASSLVASTAVYVGTEKLSILDRRKHTSCIMSANALTRNHARCASISTLRSHSSARVIRQTHVMCCSRLGREMTFISIVEELRYVRRFIVSFPVRLHFIMILQAIIPAQEHNQRWASKLFMAR